MAYVEIEIRSSSGDLLDKRREWFRDNPEAETACLVKYIAQRNYWVGFSWSYRIIK